MSDTLIIDNHVLARPVAESDLLFLDLSTGPPTYLRDVTSGRIFCSNAAGVFDIPPTCTQLSVYKLNSEDAADRELAAGAQPNKAGTSEAAVDLEHSDSGGYAGVAAAAGSALGTVVSSASSWVSMVGSVVAPVLGRASDELVRSVQLLRVTQALTTKQLAQMSQVRAAFLGSIIARDPERPMPDELCPLEDGRPQYTPDASHFTREYWAAQQTSMAQYGGTAGHTRLQAVVRDTIECILLYQEDRASRFAGFGQGGPDDPISLTLHELKRALVALAGMPTGAGLVDAVRGRLEYLEKLAHMHVFPRGHYGGVGCEECLAQVWDLLSAFLREDVPSTSA